MTFPAFNASSTIDSWPDYASFPQMWATAGSLSDKILVAAIGTDGGQLLVRAYTPTGDLLGSADLDITGWRPLAPCRAGDGAHLVQAFAEEPYGSGVRFICYNPITGDIAWDTTTTSTEDQYLFWTHDGIAYYGDDTGSVALRFDAATGTRLTDAPATYGHEDQKYYLIWDVLDFQYAADQVITVPSIGPYAPGYAMANIAPYYQGEGGGAALYGALGGAIGGIVFGPTGRTAIGLAVIRGAAPDYPVWLSVLLLGQAVTPPLRQRQRSDGLAASGAPRQHQRATLQVSNRQRAIR